MRLLELGEELLVGDIIKISHALGCSSFKVTRVTKRYALSKRESDGYEHKFSRIVKWDMAIPKQQYNMTSYSVYRPEGEPK